MKTRSGYICDFCGASVLTLPEADNAGWDWFTGFRVRTVHACSLCAARVEYHAMRAAAYRRIAPQAGGEG
jgi:hypothetical protein